MLSALLFSSVALSAAHDHYYSDHHNDRDNHIFPGSSCSDDISEVCDGGAGLNRFELYGCLYENEDILSEQCLNGIETSPLYNCAADISQLCGWTDIDGDDLLECFGDNWDLLSDNCTEAVTAWKDLYHWQYEWEQHWFLASIVVILICCCCFRRHRRKHGGQCSCRTGSCSNGQPNNVVFASSSAPPILPIHAPLVPPAMHVPIANVVNNVPVAQVVSQQHPMTPFIQSGRYVYQPIV